MTFYETVKIRDLRFKRLFLLPLPRVKWQFIGRSETACMWELTGFKLNCNPHRCFCYAIVHFFRKRVENR